MDSALYSSSSSKWQQKLPSTRRKLLCIPCCCFPLDPGLNSAHYEIFTVDITFRVSSNVLTPKLRIAFEYADTFCVLESNLYMFKSDSKAVAAIDLSKYLSSSPKSPPVEWDETLISYLSPMRHAKRDPNAIPTPDGKKILVFSSRIKFDPHDETAQQIDFELYDLDKDLWEELPPIYHNWEVLRKISCQSFRIEAFAFLNDTTLFVQTEKGMFDLYLGSGGAWHERWEDRIGLGGSGRLPLGSFSIINSELCLSPKFAFDIKNFGRRLSLRCVFPSLFGDDYKSKLKGGILNVDGGGAFYIAETAIDQDTSYPCLTIQEYHLDLSRYKKDKKKLEAKYTEEMNKLDAEYEQNRKAIKARKVDRELKKEELDKLLDQLTGDKEKLKWDLESTRPLSKKLLNPKEFRLYTHRCFSFITLGMFFVSAAGNLKRKRKA